MKKVNLLPTGLKSRRFLIIIAILQCVVYSVVFIDIPIARQVVGFLYLTFIPGIIFLRILKLDKLDITEEILLSAGLSIALLMFTGLLTNELYPLIGVSKPLSMMPFLLTINFVLLLFCLIDYFRKVDSDNFTSSKDNSVLSYPILPLILALPTMGIIGTIMVNNSQDNLLLLSVIVVISAIICLSVLSERLIPSKFYPLLLFAIGLALLSFVNFSLITRYIVGWDIHNEFYAFELTKNSGRWTSVPSSSIGFDPLKAYASLSVTILPTIYSQILGLDGTWTFKILYPLIAVLVCLGAYQLYRTQTGKRTAFLAAFFFVLVSMSIGWGSDKQIVAQLFYVLLFIIIFKGKMPLFKRGIFFMIFSFALVISHYTLSYIFMFTILLIWFSSSFLMKIPSRRISENFVILFSTLSFSWYIFVSRAATFDALIDVLGTVSTTFFVDFFNPQARSEGVLTGLGATTAVSFLHQIGRFLFYITEFFVVVGFAKCVHTLITKRKMDFDFEYIILIFVNAMILLMNIIVPNLAEAFLVERFYQTALIILAPLCILGGSTILKYFLRLHSKKLATIITLSVLVPNFLFSIGFIYEVSGDESWSIPLSLYRLKDQTWLYNNIVTEQEVLGAKWLSNHANITNILVYADHMSKYHVLLSYGMIATEHVQVLYNTTETVDDKAFIYLGYMNILFGKMRSPSFQWSTSEVSSLLEAQNKIYSDVGCDIYKGIPLNKTITTQG